jgi:hypothetical protein
MGIFERRPCPDFLIKSVPMKQRYTKVSLLAAFVTIVLHLPTHISAQCPCAGGVAPNALTYTYTLNPTGSSNNLITFPKFDPSMGQLNCVNIKDTLSVVSTLGIQSLDSSDLEYLFRFTLANNVNGPGLSQNIFTDKNYGPDSLGKYGSGWDKISYGPDTIFNQVHASKTNTTNMTPYLGTSGSVMFIYSITGGVASLAGSANFASTIKTQAWGMFSLTYYWCPSATLANNLQNFTVAQIDDKAFLQWAVGNDNPSNRYEIEFSTDGLHFNTVAALTAQSGESGLYKYMYQLGANTGAVYFRIKQMDTNGKARYSAIRKISGNNQQTPAYTVFPNPVTKTIYIQSNSKMNGDYLIELVNTAGQTVLRQNKKFNEAGSIPIELTSRPPSGVYYLRLRNISNPTNSGTLKVVLQ